jgi:hypothetical protein
MYFRNTRHTFCTLHLPSTLPPITTKFLSFVRNFGSNRSARATLVKGPKHSSVTSPGTSGTYDFNIKTYNIYLQYVTIIQQVRGPLMGTELVVHDWNCSCMLAGVLEYSRKPLQMDTKKVLTKRRNFRLTRQWR